MVWGSMFGTTNFVVDSCYCVRVDLSTEGRMSALIVVSKNDFAFWEGDGAMRGKERRDERTGRKFLSLHSPTHSTLTTVPSPLPPIPP